MVFREPGSLEIFLTIAAGRVFSGLYSQYIEGLGLRGHETVLDFGSGSGNPTRHLAQRLLEGGGRVTCVDISKEWMRVAQKQLRKYPNVEYRLGDVATLDIPEECYDAVVMHFVLHDVERHSRPAIMQHLTRKLGDGGRLFIREPLQHISRQEILRLTWASQLEEREWRVTQMPLMGTTCEAEYRKPRRMTKV